MSSSQTQRGESAKAAIADRWCDYCRSRGDHWTHGCTVADPLTVVRRIIWPAALERRERDGTWVGIVTEQASRDTHDLAKTIIEELQRMGHIGGPT